MKKRQVICLRWVQLTFTTDMFRFAAAQAEAKRRREQRKLEREQVCPSALGYCLVSLRSISNAHTRESANNAFVCFSSAKRRMQRLKRQTRRLRKKNPKLAYRMVGVSCRSSRTQNLKPPRAARNPNLCSPRAAACLCHM